MPIYEYECNKCGVTFEMMQAISAKPLKTCQGVGCDNKANGKVTRLVSASGFILKGSGWYSSDYPSEARKKGWEQEQKLANPGKADAPAPISEEKSSAPAAEASTSPKPKPAAASPKQKNPYTKAKGEKSKATK